MLYPPIKLVFIQDAIQPIVKRISRFNGFQWASKKTSYVITGALASRRRNGVRTNE
jgi:hypothetical protein